MFFTAKTHKVDVPFRVIISERDTWQKQVALFLQAKLDILRICDPFLVRNSEEVINFMNVNHDERLQAFSIDVKDLFYSIPHEDLLRSVEKVIDEYGVIRFQNEVGLSCGHFLELLTCYLKSTFILWEDCAQLQKRGICIGSCLAPRLSDLFLAQLCVKLSERLKGTKVVRTFRYVDDFLFFVNCPSEWLVAEFNGLIPVIKDCLEPLEVTHELPQNGTMRFLDLRLSLDCDHSCWHYEPRASKPLLPYHSAPSKLVKRAITKLCFKSALTKSCHHMVQFSFDQQRKRLLDAGFPQALLVSVAECILRDSKNRNAARTFEQGNRTRVLPYVHAVSHNLKKIAQRANVRVLFSAPNKLERLCKITTRNANENRGCKTNHKNKFVDCAECVVYCLPLSCGRS